MSNRDDFMTLYRRVVRHRKYAAYTGGCIWGIGESPEEAKADALTHLRTHGEDASNLRVMEASDELHASVEELGGEIEFVTRDGMLMTSDQLDWTVEDYIAVLFDRLSNPPLFIDDTEDDVIADIAEFLGLSEAYVKRVLL